MGNNLEQATQGLPTEGDPWTRFIEAGSVAPGTGLRTEIADSWIRSRDLRVDPLSGRSNWLLPPAQLAARQLAKSELIRIAKPFMQNLHTFVEGTGFLVLLFDEQGILLEAVGDPESLRSTSRLNLLPGASWAEGEIGTNGVGTALALGRPVQVSGCEHYCRKHHSFTCSGAPIRDTDGQIIAVLDMSGPVERAHLHTLGMVVAAVQAIQNELVIARRNQELTRLNQNLLSVMRAASNGLIVLDAAGRIQQVNAAAELLLAMPDGQAVGQDLDALLKDPRPLRVLLRTGLEFQDQELELALSNRAVACLASGHPILDEDGYRQGAVISVNPIQRLRHLVNRYSGSQAAFRFEDILGRGKSLQTAVEQGKDAATDDSHVLLTGESGTGKEMFAQAIHNRSHRAAGPFIALNCGAIPRELLASELFGYQEGAFTGAHKGGRPGKFELAAGGTLFLDEIGDMPLDQQVALLRVLQDRTVTRLGGERPRTVDVRIICATHRNLRIEAMRGTFREDLYYRLHVRPIHLPALREHLEDIPLLLDAFLAQRGHRPRPEVEPSVFSALQSYAWPGNIREFQNAVERILQVARGAIIRLEHLPEEIIHPHLGALHPPEAPGPILPAHPAHPAGLKDLRQRLDQQARSEILMALQASQGHVAGAAQSLGIARNTLYRRMAKLGI